MPNLQASRAKARNIRITHRRNGTFHEDLSMPPSASRAWTV
jgi:hypothetical protein